MPGTLLRVNQLSLTTTEGVVVRDLSFTIDRGEIVALTGKSGSGKTSIALALLGLLPDGVHFSGGSIQLHLSETEQFNYPADKSLWPALRGRYINYIQQDVFGAFDPVIKMGRQLLMVVRARAANQNDNHVEELKSIMAELGLQDADRILNSYPHQLSGGQLQRCLLCMSIMIRPALLIADEPTSAIDKINQVELLDLLKRIRSTYDISILIITHDPAVVLYLADREIGLDQPIQNKRLFPGKLASIDKSNIILQASHLEYFHRYGGIIQKAGAAVKDVSFTLSRGNCMGIVGPSGSGKSTLAHLLVGLLIPSKGDLYLDAEKIDFSRQSGLKKLRSKVQLVMQDGRGSLHPEKTIRKLLSEIIELQGIKMDQAEILVNSLREVGLAPDILDRTAGRLSGGECLRVSIARTLLVNPEILICDESTSALDTDTRDGIMDLLHRLMKKRNLGLILITHDEAVIRQLATEIYVIFDGRIVEKGEALTVIENPQHPVTKRIFGLEATLTGKKHL